MCWGKRWWQLLKERNCSSESKFFPFEVDHQGDSNEYTQYTIFNMNKKVTINYPKSAAMGFFSQGHKNEFETAVVNEPSVFEPLKFYCISKGIKACLTKILCNDSFNWIYNS